MIISLRNIAQMMVAGLTAAGFIAGVTSPAAAETIRGWQSGDWSAAASTNDETKVFEHCRGSRTTRSGGSFSLARLRNMNWVLFFTIPVPVQMPTGMPLQIGIRIDQGPRFLLDVHMVNNRAVEGEVPTNSNLVEAIRRGRSLTFDGPHGHHDVTRLDGADTLIAELTQCVQTQVAAEERTSVAPSTQQAAQPSSTAVGQQAAAMPATGSQTTAAQGELAAMRIASNLLLQAKLPHAHLLAPADTPVVLRGLGAAWTSDAGIGAVSIIQNAPGRDVRQVALGTIIAGANGCRGEFAAGRSTSLVDDTLVTKAFTACSDAAGSRNVHFFILHRETSWYIVYAIIPPASGPGGVERATAPSPLQDSSFQAAAVTAALYQ